MVCDLLAERMSPARLAPPRRMLWKCRRLFWFCFNTCGRVLTLGIRGSVRRRQKFVDPFTLLDAQGGDGLPQLPDAGPLAVAILHAVASRGCSHSLFSGSEWLVRSRSSLALV